MVDMYHLLNVVPCSGPITHGRRIGTTNRKRLNMCACLLADWFSTSSSARQLDVCLLSISRLFVIVLIMQKP
jgi:hypothetical protein